VTTTSGDHLIHLPRAGRGTTPTTLRISAAAIGVVALIAALVTTAAAARAGSGMSTVAHTDAPSVRATEDFLYQLQDMDAQLLNALLVNGDTTVQVPRSASENLLDRDRRAADGDLEAATAALAADPDALKQLHAVSDTFGQYHAQAVRTLADDERDGGTAAGNAPGSVIADYLAGHTILFGEDDQGGLMKTAADLEKRSADAIGTSASSAEGSLSGVAIGFAVSGLTLLVGLTALQIYGFHRFHRVVNPGLAAATVVALVFTIGGGSAATIAADDFHTAASDAFDSVLALSRAKADSAGANADESRWLLVHGLPGQQQARFEASFLARSQAVAGVPAPDLVSYTTAVGAVEQATGAYNLAETDLDPARGFGREFRNITFPEEALPAYTAFADFDEYLKADAHLRRLPLDTADQVKAAIDFDTDAGAPNTSDQAFNAYSTALDAVIGVNQAHFDRSISAAGREIGIWTWLPYPLAVLIVGLTTLGVRKRLNEYR
jgi:hypothetical protein